jgi:hypothetical protein
VQSSSVVEQDPKQETIAENETNAEDFKSVDAEMEKYLGSDWKASSTV